MKRRQLLSAALAASSGSLLSPLARAQGAYPTKNINYIIPFVAGGESDVVARWGGEEFLAILPDTDESAARVLVEGLKRAGKSPTRASFVSGLESAGAIDLGGGNLIVLQGVQLSTLTAGDFIFA